MKCRLIIRFTEQYETKLKMFSVSLNIQNFAKYRQFRVGSLFREKNFRQKMKTLLLMKTTNVRGDKSGHGSGWVAVRKATFWGIVLVKKKRRGGGAAPSSFD
jgi:hypothetical protein